MSHLLRLLLVISMLGLATDSVSAQGVATSDGYEPLDEVVVSGVRSGPRLWKVTQGDHELWILGVLDPLPDKMQWQSQEVAAVVAESQAVLMDEMSVSADAGLFAKVGLYLQWRRLQKNPDHKTLREVLPADLYARFAALNQHYAKSNSFDEFRPMVASAKLYAAAIDHMGLNSRHVVSQTVEKLARQHGLKPQTLHIRITQPRELLDSMARISHEDEISCLTATMSSVEADVNVLRERANAWALGDVDTLRSIMATENRSACWAALISVPRIEALTRQAAQEWIELAETSLQNHRSTLALRAIRDLLATDGMLAQFRARGYQVSGP